MQTLQSPPKLLTTDEAAAYLGIKKSSLVTWRCTGKVKIPFVKIGHAVRYRPSDLETFLNDNMREG